MNNSYFTNKRWLKKRIYSWSKSCEESHLFCPFPELDKGREALLFVCLSWYQKVLDSERLFWVVEGNFRWHTVPKLNLCFVQTISINKWHQYQQESCILKEQHVTSMHRSLLLTIALLCEHRHLLYYCTNSFKVIMVYFSEAFLFFFFLMRK